MLRIGLIVKGFAFATLLIKSDAHFFTAFLCSNDWTLRYNDTRVSSIVFSNWLFAWQNSCDKTVNPFAAASTGIGASVNQAIRTLSTSIESNQIYRPHCKDHIRQPPGVWLWADNDASKCTFGLRSIDCYLQPISVCGFDEGSVYQLQSQMASNIQLLSSSSLDTCGMAKIVGKPLQWIAAHMVSYILRYKEDMQRDINGKVNAVLWPVLKDKKRLSTSIGVHVRGGSPDGGREVLNVSDYMVHVDKIAVKMAEVGTPVRIVYLSSHVQEENIISADHMRAMYPNRDYEFKVLPHLSLGPGETEHAIKRNGTGVDKRTISLEFYADIEIFTAVDYFIGSSSNVYTIVSSLRIARPRAKPLFLNQTCLLDFHSNGNSTHHTHELYCEGSDHAKNRWRSDHGGFENKYTDRDWFNPELYD